MVAVLVTFAVLIGVVSLAFVSQATAGVAGIAFACLLGILARIAQAERQIQPKLTKEQEDAEYEKRFAYYRGQAK